MKGPGEQNDCDVLAALGVPDKRLGIFGTESNNEEDVARPGPPETIMHCHDEFICLNHPRLTTFPLPDVRVPFERLGLVSSNHLD